jgi:hypothetical protein
MPSADATRALLPAPEPPSCGVVGAVISGAPLSLLGLPSELFLKTCGYLDARALCLLAQVSAEARRSADDREVWREVCGCGRGAPWRPSHSGHCKAYQRARHSRRLRRQAEERVLKERRRRERRRWWKRQFVHCLQVACGVALVMLARAREPNARPPCSIALLHRPAPSRWRASSCCPCWRPPTAPRVALVAAVSADQRALSGGAGIYARCSEGCGGRPALDGGAADRVGERLPAARGWALSAAAHSSNFSQDVAAHVSRACDARRPAGSACGRARATAREAESRRRPARG